MLPAHINQVHRAIESLGRSLRALADLKVRSASGESVAEAIEIIVGDVHAAKQQIEMVMMSGAYHERNFP